MLKPSQVKKLKEQIDGCKRPLIFYDGDCDGLTSFLQLYRYKGEGRGVVLKTKPQLTKEYLRKVEEFEPDSIFIFDVAIVDQDFIDGVKVPIYWFDHHGPYERTGKHLHYINPLHWNETTSPCVMIHQICNQDMWISAVGAIADYQFPYYLDEFIKKYPKLISKKKYKNPFDIRFNTPFGKLIKIFSFNLKGTTSNALRSIKVMSRIKTPEEILDQTSPQGKFLYKKYEKLNKEYELLKKSALKSYKKDDAFFIHKYTEDQTSFTKDLADDLMYNHPDKVIVLARQRQGYMVMSMRTTDQGPEIKDAVEKALVGIDGAGGGHAHACGAKVAKVDFERFISKLREELSL